MSSDPYQLISQLVRLQHGQNQQILSINSTANQTMQSNQSALSSDGPNASQRIQVANSNIITYNLNFIGNSNLGTTRVIANGDHGAYLNHQDSQSTANPVDLRATEAAVKNAVMEVVSATDPLTRETDRLAKTTAKFSEWVTAFDWPTFKLGLVSEPAITLGDIAIKHCISTIELSQSIIEFGRSSVEFGASVYSNSMTIRAELRESLSDGSTSIHEEIARYKKESYTFLNCLPMYDTSRLEESARAHEMSASQLSELIGHAVDFATLKEIAVDLGQSANTVGKSLTTFGKLVVAYSKVLDGVLLAVQRLATSSHK